MPPGVSHRRRGAGMMSDQDDTNRDEIYLKVLAFGLARLRDAAPTGNVQYWAVEAEHLHNIPYLIGEPNEARHRYYFDVERVWYLEQIDRSVPEIDYTLRRYEELWLQLAKIRNRV